ncbi:MAG TPA: RuBisCO large subunit C-terminal-like domain-containing protein [Methanomassiliicoccales archaeon]|jgi:ribulose-bisphosphate carboxylase large chain|nr:RuBisCO large subunit C-terminal-like domain-containing protein [Methanomassiliicoccales archaeon]
MEYEERYLHLDQPVDVDKHVICRYKVGTDLKMTTAAAAIATEQSTGTWTKLSTLKEDNFLKRSGKVTKIEGNMATIAFPVEDFSLDIGGVPQILSIIAGNLFGLEALHTVRLEDVTFPKCILKEFKGPKYGIDGMRSILKRPTKPLVGTIVKPKIGLSPKETADYVYEAGMGGLTNGKDDETLSNQKFCPLEDRVVAIAEALDRVKSETGHVMIHAINVSTNGHQILEVAERAQELGATELMVDVLTCGFGAIQVLAEDPSIKLPIHVHRTMHGAMTRNQDHGINMKVFATLARMVGGDALHVGTFGVGKMKGAAHEDLANRDMCLTKELPYKRVMPVASGGVHPGMIKKLVEIAGTELQIQAGGGVSGHPGGVRGGARAMVQAVDAAAANVPLDVYAKDHAELAAAIKKWGLA